MIVTTNSTALQILKGIESNAQSKDLTDDWTRPPNRGPQWSRAGGYSSLVEPVSDAAKDAIAKIVAILGEAGGTVDLSGTSYSNAYVSAHDGATIIGGAGNDSISAYDNANVVGGDGSDSIGVYRYAKVDSGAGDDWIHTSAYSDIIAGDGNDWVYVEHGYSKIDAGNGDDYVYSSRYSQVDAGAGNDEIRAYDYSSIDAGDGNDLVITYGASTIKGGAGNDILIATERPSVAADPTSWDYGFANGNNNIDGGEGDDYIQTTDNSTVRGGAGNDTIRLIGSGSTVSFAKGDGQDAIISRDDFTLSIAGYSKDDVTVRGEGDALTISFRGSDESISLNLSSGAAAHLVFEDGASFDITGTEASKSLTFLAAKPDWGSREDAFDVAASSGRPW